MKYDHRIKFGGKWYLPGEEVPIDAANDERKDTTVAEIVVPTKTEIQRMNKATLLETARKHGMSASGEMTVAALKSMLIEHFM